MGHLGYAGGGKIFDFNATLPLMAAHFVLLSYFLESTWFGPVGSHIDARTNNLRSRLESLTSNRQELEALKLESTTIVANPRAESQKMVSDARKASSITADEKIGELSARLSRERSSVLSSLEDEKNSLINELRAESSGLSDYIVSRL